VAARGQASDIRIQADEILFLKTRLNRELAARTATRLPDRAGTRDVTFFIVTGRGRGPTGLIDRVLIERRPIRPVS